MKTSECTIYVMSKHGWVQKYRREKESWIQTGANGAARSLSAEQLLSHILPLLAGTGHFTVKVEPDNKNESYRVGWITILVQHPFCHKILNSARKRPLTIAQRLNHYFCVRANAAN